MHLKNMIGLILASWMLGGLIGCSDITQTAVKSDSLLHGIVSEENHAFSLYGRVNGCYITTAQHEMLEFTNNNRIEGAICGDVEKEPVEPLIWDCNAMDVAASHSNDMASNNFFNHVGSDGLRVSGRVTNAKLNWKSVGENLSAGHDNVELSIKALMKSPGHCTNIMNPDYTHMGAFNAFNLDTIYESYWTQVFVKYIEN